MTDAGGSGGSRSRKRPPNIREVVGTREALTWTPFPLSLQVGRVCRTVGSCQVPATSARRSVGKARVGSCVIVPDVPSDLLPRLVDRFPLRSPGAALSEESLSWAIRHLNDFIASQPVNTEPLAHEFVSALAIRSDF
jgi:hypothetical protein